MAIFNYSFRVDLTDVSEDNKMTNPAILKYFQEAGALHSDHIGLGNNDIPTTHLSWILLNWKLQVLKRPIWNTNITVHTWCHHTEKFHTYRDFEMYDDKQNLVAIASSKWVLLNTETQKIAKIDPELIVKYQPEEKKAFSVFPEKLKEPEQYSIQKEFEVQRKDIDTNHHVNNISYLKFAYEIIPLQLLKKDFSQVEIMYKKATRYGEDYMVSFYQESETICWVTIKSPDLSVLHATIRLEI